MSKLIAFTETNRSFDFIFVNSCPISFIFPWLAVALAIVDHDVHSYITLVRIQHATWVGRMLSLKSLKWLQECK